MLKSILDHFGLAGSTSSLAAYAVSIVKNINNATNLSLTDKQRKRARKNFIEKFINLVTPVVVGAIAGIFSYSAAAIPAAQMTQKFLKASGIGKMIGKLLHPLLAPITHFFGFLKEKVKQYLGIDVNKVVDYGVGIVEPIVGEDTTKAASMESSKASADKRNIHDARKHPMKFSSAKASSSNEKFYPAYTKSGNDKRPRRGHVL